MIKFKSSKLKEGILKNYIEKIDPFYMENEITEEMMEKFELLDLNDLEIDDLSGIEYAKNIRLLYIANNNIEDISPLENCSKLEILDFHKNKISDIWPLEKLS